MRTTRARRQLINDAKANGCTIEETEGCVQIHTGKTFRSVGISVWPDGTALRNDISLDACLVIRTVKMMREILNLKG